MPPFLALHVAVSFLRPATLGLFPEAALTGFVRSLLAQPTADYARLWIVCPRRAQARFVPGDVLHFAIYAFASEAARLQVLIERLQNLPGSAHALPHSAPLGANVRLLTLTDHLHGGTVKCAADLQPQSAAAQHAEAAFWHAQTHLRICIESPWRVLKAETRAASQRTSGTADKFCRNEADLDGALLSFRLGRSLAELAKSLKLAAPWVEPVPLHIAAKELFWLAQSYQSRRGEAIPLGGLLGEILLRVDADWPEWFWQALINGQHLGFGEKRAFGLGRYRLESTEGRRFSPQFPAQTASLTAALAPAALQRAIEHSQSEPGDDVTQDQTDALFERVSRDAQALVEGSYTPKALHRVVLPKPDGSTRELLVAPRPDRVLQRALMAALDDLITPHFAAESYGFIRGRNREQARDALLAHYQAGRRWALESDVASFFDSVDLWRIAVRLRALLGDDPICDPVLAFLAAPEATNGSLKARQRGLPQGSPLSPLMANLLLDDFDQDCIAEGLHVVRYADDFVVACTSEAEAKRALTVAQASLAEKGLGPKSRKTRIVHFDQGFHFLGYVFAGGMAVESKSGAQFVGNAALVAETASDIEVENPFEQALALPPADDFGRLLVLTASAKVLRLHAGRIHWSTADDTIGASCPFAGLSAIVLIGRSSITTPLLHAALKAQVPIHFADSHGRYLGATAPAVQAAQLTLWQAQAAAFSEPARALAYAKQIVGARIRHQSETLRQRAQAALPEFERLAMKAQAAQDRAELTGYEGAAAAAYFGGLQTLVPRDFGFNGRKRRPPPDPFNALLSYGYTLLYAHTDVVLRAMGLLSTVGFYHQGRGTHAALASDFMEPFRHLVERASLSMLRRKQLSWADFRRKGDGGIEILSAARHSFIAELERSFAEPRKAAGESTAKTLHEHLETMALRLRASFADPALFRATRLR
jgi:group II intron reverse transcriptase/maturase/CRISPR-associated endonuclease Cas1